MNPSATNLANITSNDYRAFLEKEKQNLTKKYHVLSDEQRTSSSNLNATTKTPPNMERTNNTMQNFYKKNNQQKKSIK